MYARAIRRAGFFILSCSSVGRAVRIVAGKPQHTVRSSVRIRPRHLRPCNGIARHSKNNMTFSAIAGESFTNGQVVLTHIGLVVFLMVAIAAGN